MSVYTENWPAAMPAAPSAAVAVPPSVTAGNATSSPLIAASRPDHECRRVATAFPLSAPARNADREPNTPNLDNQRAGIARNIVPPLMADEAEAPTPGSVVLPQPRHSKYSESPSTGGDSVE